MSMYPSGYNKAGKRGERPCERLERLESAVSANRTEIERLQGALSVMLASLACAVTAKERLTDGT